MVTLRRKLSFVKAAQVPVEQNIFVKNFVKTFSAENKKSILQAQNRLFSFYSATDNDKTVCSGRVASKAPDGFNKTS
jgi:hypothetical protein